MRHTERMSDADPQTPWMTIAALYGAGLGAAAQFAKISVPFEALNAAYPGAGVALGFVVSLISVLGVVFGFTAGVVVSILGFRKMLIWALVLGAALSALQALMLPLQLLLATRVLEGLSHLVIVVAAPTMMAQISAPKDRALVMTLWSTFFGMAFAVVAWVGLPMVERQGLSPMLWAHALWMAAIAAGLFVILPRLTSADDRPAWPTLGQTIKAHGQAYASPHQAAPALGWVAYTTVFVAAMTMIPTTLTESARGWAVPLLPLAGMAVSLSFGVALTRIIPAVRIAMLGFGLAVWHRCGAAVYAAECRSGR